MDIKDLKIILTYKKSLTVEDDDSKEYVDDIDITVGTIYITEKEMDSEEDYISEFKLDDVDKVYLTCFDYSELNYYLFNNGLDFCFCLDLNIYYKDKCIGKVSFNRIFVESVESISIWIDNEAPNSMDILKYICKSDFRDVEGRFIGIVDELIIDDDYATKEILQSSIILMQSLIHVLDFNLYYIYTQPKKCKLNEYSNAVMSKDSEKIYNEFGYKTVNQEKMIMRKDIWHDTEREKFENSFMDSFYLS